MKTLEQLIEECGDEFFALIRRFDDESNDTYWFAYNGDEVGYGIPCYTPREAVEKLLKKIKKQKNETK